MHNVQCKFCGYENYFETEADTNKTYCVYCGHYLSIHECPE